MYLLETEFHLCIYPFRRRLKIYDIKKEETLLSLLILSYWLHIWPVWSETLWGYNLYTLTKTSLIRRLFIRFSLSHSIHAARNYERTVALVAASIVFFEFWHFDFPVVSFPNGSFWIVRPAFDFFSTYTAFHNYQFLLIYISYNFNYLTLYLVIIHKFLQHN